MRRAGRLWYYERGVPLAQFDLSVTDRPGVTGTSLICHAKAIHIVKLQTMLEEQAKWINFGQASEAQLFQKAAHGKLSVSSKVSLNIGPFCKFNIALKERQPVISVAL